MRFGGSIRALLALVLLVSSASAQALLLDDGPLEHDPEELLSEIGILRAVGEGVLLTLAACEDEPHCISGLAEREVVRVLSEVESRISTLEEAQRVEYREALDGYRHVRDLFARASEDFRTVKNEVGVEVKELEGRWSDHFQADDVMGGVEGLDFLNEHVSLDHFEDVDDPLPIY